MKTKLLKIFAVMLLVLTALGSRAQSFTSGDFEYRFYDTKLYVYGLSSTGENQPYLYIPSAVSYGGSLHRVVGINDYAFWGKTNIVSVRINYGVVYINPNAFEGCTSLITVNLPSSLKMIMNNAFKGCTALRNVYYSGFSFPQGSVSTSAFPNNSNMSLYIPYQSLKTPADYKARPEYSNFTNVVNSVYAYDFSMGDGGFYCIGWPDDDGPSTVRSATLTGFYISSTATQYKPTSATYTSYNLQFSIDTIGANAFQAQSTLTSIDLTNASNLKYFGSQDKNKGIQYVTELILPKSSFGYSTLSFLHFDSLEEFKLASGSTKFSIYEGCLYNYSKTTLIKVPNAKEGHMSYPSSLKTVWNWSHCNCLKITHAMLPYGVTTINTGAFYNTPLLDYVRIPSSVTNLSNDRVFQGTKSNNWIYCNMDNPPTVTASSYFGNNSNMNLYIPYNKESTYASSGWTGFNDVNPNGRQAYDYPNNTSTLCYSVTSNNTVTGADGITYSGRARLVCNGITSNDDAPSTITIPPSVTISGKEYVINKIGDDAFNNRTTTNFSVKGCVNVDTIGEYAFEGQAITSYHFTHNLKNILYRAFYGAGLTGTVALPYGLEKLGSLAFGNGKYSRIIVPSSINSINGYFCYGTSTLTELVLNLKSSTFYIFSGWNLTDVPSTCRILVPTGVVNQYKQNVCFSSRANYINAGAYDFVRGTSYTGYYYMTVLSNAPATFNNFTYAGKAKYVYHPNIQNSTSTGNYGFSNWETDMSDPDDLRQYLITEIGDSLLYGSKYTGGYIPAGVTRIGQSAFRNCQFAANPLFLPEGLTFIGHDAFYESKIGGELIIPTTVTTLESYSLCATTLNSILFPDKPMPNMGQSVWSQFINYGVYVPNHRAPEYLAKANSWGTSYGNKLAVWIMPSATTAMFSSVVPVDFSGTVVKAYYASAYNKNNTGKEVTMTQVSKIPANTGVLLTNLQSNSRQRFDRPTGSVTAPSTNYLVGTPDVSVDVYSKNVGYYWNNQTPSNLRFVKPTSNYMTRVGGAYLKLSTTEASGKSEVFTNLYPGQSGGIPGDVNGDGQVTAADVTALYDYLLNEDSSQIVNGDQTGDGLITAADVTAVYGVLLEN